MCIWKMLSKLKKFPSIIRFRPTGDLVKFEFEFKLEQSAGGVREVRPSALER